MNKLKEIWAVLENERERLESPCDGCGYYECKKFTYNDILKKRYADFNIIDYKECLKSRKEELERLNMLRRNVMFNKVSFGPCSLCKKKYFKDDLNLNFETEKQNKEKTNKAFEGRFIYTCSKCKPKYKKMKVAYHGDGFSKGI